MEKILLKDSLLIERKYTEAICRILRYLFLISLAQSTIALGTEVSGSISTDTIWTAEGSPYLLTGDLTIDVGSTLTIEAGVLVESELTTVFRNVKVAYTIFVQGTLNSNGANIRSNIEILSGGHADLDSTTIEDTPGHDVIGPWIQFAQIATGSVKNNDLSQGWLTVPPSFIENPEEHISGNIYAEDTPLNFAESWTLSEDLTLGEIDGLSHFSGDELFIPEGKTLKVKPDIKLETTIRVSGSLISDSVILGTIDFKDSSSSNLVNTSVRQMIFRSGSSGSLDNITLDSAYSQNLIMEIGGLSDWTLSEIDTSATSYLNIYGGIINEDMSLSDHGFGLYLRFLGDMVIANDATLSITSDVWTPIYSYLELTVNGTLVINGTTHHMDMTAMSGGSIEIENSIINANITVHSAAQLEISGSTFRSRKIEISNGSSGLIQNNTFEYISLRDYTGFHVSPENPMQNWVFSNNSFAPNTAWEIMQIQGNSLDVNANWKVVEGLSGKYRISELFTIRDGAKLTLEPGLELSGGWDVVIEGTLVADMVEISTFLQTLSGGRLEISNSTFYPNSALKINADSIGSVENNIFYSPFFSDPYPIFINQPDELANWEFSNNEGIALRIIEQTLSSNLTLSVVDDIEEFLFPCEFSVPDSVVLSISEGVTVLGSTCGRTIEFFVSGTLIAEKANFEVRLSIEEGGYAELADSSFGQNFYAKKGSSGILDSNYFHQEINVSSDDPWTNWELTSNEYNYGRFELYGDIENNIVLKPVDNINTYYGSVDVKTGATLTLDSVELPRRLEVNGDLIMRNAEAFTIDIHSNGSIDAKDSSIIYLELAENSVGIVKNNLIRQVSVFETAVLLSHNLIGLAADDYKARSNALIYNGSVDWTLLPNNFILDSSGENGRVAVLNNGSALITSSQSYWGAASGPHYIAQEGYAVSGNILIEDWATSPVEDGDFDQDGLINYQELLVETSLTDPDTDGDAINDADEIALGSNPTDVDSDDDGLNDNIELSLGTGILDSDSDSDGLLDGEEMVLNTSPLNADTDGDGITDALDPFPLNPDTSIDTDGDGIPDSLDMDDDNDGFSDEEELKSGKDPLDASDSPMILQGIMSRPWFRAIIQDKQ